MPAGVTLTPAGLLSGTPDPGTGGTHNVTLTATNGIGANAVQAFTLTVNEAPAITSANTATFSAGHAGDDVPGGDDRHPGADGERHRRRAADGPHAVGGRAAVGHADAERIASR